MSEKDDSTKAHETDNHTTEMKSVSTANLPDMPGGSPSPIPKPVKPADPERTRRQRMVVASLSLGLVGGIVGSLIFIRFFPAVIPVDKKILAVQESSAVIDVAKKQSPSVVSITSKQLTTGFFGIQQQEEGAGTGIIVSADGLILTNKHVVPEGTSTVTVVTNDGKQYANARVLARDPLNDIAFVKITASGLPVATLGDSSSVQVGQSVVAIGNALGQFQNSVTTGIISGIGRPITAGDSSGSASENLQNLFQTDAAINPGNSGGPLFNLLGQVIGINTAVAGQGSQNIGFAIPINEVKPLIASVEKSGVIVRPYLGVHYVQLSPEVASANNLNVSAGAWVVGSNGTAAIVPGSPADKAGIKDGDIITKVQGQALDGTHSLSSEVTKYKVGETISLTVIRDGKTQTIAVKLEAAPASTNG